MQTLHTQHTATAAYGTNNMLYANNFIAHKPKNRSSTEQRTDTKQRKRDKHTHTQFPVLGCCKCVAGLRCPQDENVANYNLLLPLKFNIMCAAEWAFLFHPMRLQLAWKSIDAIQIECNPIFSSKYALCPSALSLCVFSRPYQSVSMSRLLFKQVFWH